MSKPAYIDLIPAKFGLAHRANEAVAAQLKILLEEKHLYQSVVVDFLNIYESYLPRLITDSEKDEYRQFASEFQEKLAISDQQLFSAARNEPRYPLPTLLLQNVKLYCSECGQRETFSPTWFVDMTDSIAGRNAKGEHRIAPPPRYFQLFTFSLQCETCRKIPVGFLVKRGGWKLTLEGRSPFEEVEVPKSLPKTESWLYSDAIIAEQAGKTLAGLFYLRSFVEQFARRQTGIWVRENGDKILEAYQSLLPDGQRDHMPSLRSWYTKLSEPIHAANSDALVFEEARAAILEHFEFRRLYKIPEVAKDEKKAARSESK